MNLGRSKYFVPISIERAFGPTPTFNRSSSCLGSNFTPPLPSTPPRPPQELRPHTHTHTPIFSCRPTPPISRLLVLRISRSFVQLFVESSNCSSNCLSKRPVAKLIAKSSSHSFNCSSKRPVSSNRSSNHPVIHPIVRRSVHSSLRPANICEMRYE